MSDVGAQPVEYGDFAWFYDLYWAPEAVGWELVVVEKLLVEELAPSASVLEVCCGSGRLADALTQRGIAVTGIDVSKEMIELARLNAPDAEFVVVDVRELDLGRSFDAAVSMYDSLNHLLSREDLQAALCRVAGSLVDGGLFVFDLNTETGIEAWKPMTLVEHDAAFVVECAFDPVERRGRFDFTGFRRDGCHWRRVDVSLEQTWFDDDEVQQALLAAGLEPVSSHDRADLLGAGAPGHKQIYVARA